MRRYQVTAGVLSILLFLSSALSAAQSTPTRGLRTSAEKRLLSMEQEWKSCDNLSSEGERFLCMDRVLAAYEYEVLRLNSEARSNLCHEMIPTFDQSVNAWSVYYRTEKSHISQLNECHGTQNLYAIRSTLIDLLSSRCYVLASQLIDGERRELCLTNRSPRALSPPATTSSSHSCFPPPAVAPHLASPGNSMRYAGDGNE